MIIPNDEQLLNSNKLQATPLIFFYVMMLLKASATALFQSTEHGRTTAGASSYRVYACLITLVV